MRTRFFLAILGCAWPAAASAADFRFVNQTLTVSDGFTVELAAEPPLVDRPITCDFDEQGRLYVSDSSGTNDPVEKQLADKPHRVLRLEDTDGDGKFDRRTVFADKLMFPEGTMWFRGSLYVSAPPSIWKLTDTDDDGVADKREEWFAGKTLTGCANDLHGPYRGRDGWIYWCKGAFAEQTHDLPNQPGWKTRAAHIFRARPDGTGIEPVLTGGMDNPVDVIFTPEGERILSCTFFINPTGGKRDGLIHAIYGGVYGKVHDVLDGHPRTGELMPELVHLGPAAPCGLHFYESTALGSDIRGNVFACQFNLRTVSRHKLIPSGSSYITEDNDFLTSDFADFHPTDVIEDADGSLLVCDTGGWYKLCCPTSQFHKPEVLGAIYRIRRTETAKIADPRGRKIDWQSASNLTKLLGDPRPMVRDQAMEALAGRGGQAIDKIRRVLDDQTASLGVTRLHAVWTASRIDDPRARELVRSALADPDASVQHAAAHAAGTWRDRAALQKLCECLKGTSPAVVRAAAEALGRLGDPQAVPPLLAASERADDRALEHSIIYALIEINDPAAIRPALRAAGPRQRRATLIALSQIPSAKLTADEVLPFLAAAEPVLRDAAWWVAERNPQWGDRIAQHLVGQLRNPPQGTAGEQLASALARLTENPAIQKLIVATVDDAALPIEVRTVALQAISQSRVSPLPAIWIECLARAVENAQLRGPGVAAMQSLGLAKEHRQQLRPALVKMASIETEPFELRLTALETLGDVVGELPSPIFSQLKSAFASESLPLVRASGANVLAQAQLNSQQQLEIADLIGNLGPLEVSRLLPALIDSDDDVRKQVLASLLANDDLTGVRKDVLTAFVEKLPPALRSDGDALLAQVDASLGQRRNRLDELFESLAGGDPKRGHAVFNSKKVACAGCHAMAYAGGQLGPDLTRVGQIRTERDLLEAIVYPSASFVRSYEPLLVVTASGHTLNGLLRQETQHEIVIATGPQTSERIPRSEVEELRPGLVSLMPEGLEKLLTPQELADLVAYLKASR